MHQITSSGQPPASDTRKMVEDVFRILGVLLRGWRFIAVAMVICLSAAAIYLAKTKPVYHASARLLVLQQGNRPINVAGGGDVLQHAQAHDSLATHLMIIRSPMIVGSALETADLKGLSVGGVIGKLTVTKPEEAANVIELAYQADTSHEAEAVVKALIESYQQFLKDNYQLHFATSDGCPTA